ncbi:MAG: efflux RND transporter periplasmic adaptor subunit [Vicinamibacterales bacterium]|nr:efflux RND transporter periplasmic adaptor subunit [Vicinamibacterales bacterium]
MQAYRAAAAAAFLTFAALLASSCGGGGGQARQGAPQGFPPTPVKLVDARTTPIEDATEYVAMLKSLRSTTIKPQIDGQITQIFVKSGDRVGQGSRLMQIDPQRQQAAVSSQEAERAAREANVAYARQQQQRANELFAAGAISKQELEQSQTALRTAEASLQALQAQVQQQQVQLRYYTISAPTSGIVADVPARVGMQVSTSTVLTTIEQNDTLEVYVSVPVERSGDLKMGLPLKVMSSDGKDTLAATTVGFISPSVDEATQSILVKGTVRNPDGELRSSQFVRARIVWKTADGLVVPVTAVARVSGQYFVFVAEGGDGKDNTKLVAHQRGIKVGSIVGDDYPVLEGIKPGEKVVISGSQKLVDGAPIAPAPEGQPPTAAAPRP